MLISSQSGTPNATNNVLTAFFPTIDGVSNLVQPQAQVQLLFFAPQTTWSGTSVLNPVNAAAGNAPFTITATTISGNTTTVQNVNINYQLVAQQVGSNSALYYSPSSFPGNNCS